MALHHIPGSTASAEGTSTSIDCGVIKRNDLPVAADFDQRIGNIDLSALDDADIRDSAYTDFFTTVNKKMT